MFLASKIMKEDGINEPSCKKVDEQANFVMHKMIANPAQREISIA